MRVLRDPRRCDQRHRRGRGAAADERRQRGARRGGVPRASSERKTAKLFEAAAQLGAVLGERRSRRARTRSRRYGMHLGTAFQIMDDVLDYTGDAAAIGKNLGDDLAEGKMTLPLIRALAVGSAGRCGRDPARDRGRRAHRLRARDGALERTGALAYARERAATRRARRRRAASTAFRRRPYRQNFATIDGFRGRSTVLT